jgi:hypothetical protein
MFYPCLLLICKKLYDCIFLPPFDKGLKILQPSIWFLGANSRWVITDAWVVLETIADFAAKNPTN